MNATEEKSGSQSFKILFPYGLWLREELDKIRSKRENLQESGVNVKKCGKYKICDDLVEGKTLSENKGKKTDSLTH